MCPKIALISLWMLLKAEAVFFPSKGNNWGGAENHILASGLGDLLWCGGSILPTSPPKSVLSPQIPKVLPKVDLGPGRIWSPIWKSEIAVRQVKIGNKGCGDLRYLQRPKNRLRDLKFPSNRCLLARSRDPPIFPSVIPKTLRRPVGSRIRPQLI